MPLCAQLWVAGAPADRQAVMVRSFRIYGLNNRRALLKTYRIFSLADNQIITQDRTEHRVKKQP